MIRLVIRTTRPDQNPNPLDGMSPEVRARFELAGAVVDKKGRVLVPGDLDLSGLVDLRGLPAKLRLGGSLDLRGCPHVRLSSSLEVGNTLYLDDKMGAPLPAMRVGCFVSWRDMCRLWIGPKTFLEVS